MGPRCSHQTTWEEFCPSALLPPGRIGGRVPELDSSAAPRTRSRRPRQATFEGFLQRALPSPGH
eukprot:4445821-Pyramimonas_sp.AAC.1